MFADIPEAIENAVEIARRCSFELKLGESVLPAFPVPEGQNETAFLREQAKLGLDAQLAQLFERDDVAENEQNRISLVWEYNPMQFVQARIGYRNYSGIPQNPVQNREQLFAEVHLFF